MYVLRSTDGAALLRRLGHFLRQPRLSRTTSSDSSNGDEIRRPHPVTRTAKLLVDDLSDMKDKVLGRKRFGQRKEIFPHYCDVLIVGGGVMGYSIAYWLQHAALNNLRIVVVEKDPTYKKCTSVLSVGGMRQQFSLKENVELSMASAEFLRNINMHLDVEGEEPPDVAFNPCGYLFLASDIGAPILQENCRLQKSLGANVELLSPEMLKQKFPFLNTDGIVLGSHGLENEGWFDPWSLLNAFKRKAVHLGVDVVNGTVTKFGFQKNSPIYTVHYPIGEYKHAEAAYVRLDDGSVKTINFSKLIIAAGAESGNVGSMLGIGNGKGLLAAPLPIEPRKRFVYVIHCPDGPGLAMPFIIDPSGAYIRREGFSGNYICGMSPALDDPEPSCDNLDVDYNFFEDRVWPVLANRVPAFENSKLKSAWSGFYDFNSFDENAFIGPHPAFHNIFVVAGFSGHGIQQSPAVGRAVSELIFDGAFKTIDLTRFGVDRYYEGEPLYESNIV